MQLQRSCLSQFSSWSCKLFFRVLTLQSKGGNWCSGLDSHIAEWILLGREWWKLPMPSVGGWKKNRKTAKTSQNSKYAFNELCTISVNWGSQILILNLWSHVHQAQALLRSSFLGSLSSSLKFCMHVPTFLPRYITKNALKDSVKLFFYWPSIYGCVTGSEEGWTHLRHGWILIFRAQIVGLTETPHWEMSKSNVPAVHSGSTASITFPENPPGIITMEYNLWVWWIPVISLKIPWRRAKTSLPAELSTCI